jgi:hypothetical protein
VVHGENEDVIEVGQLQKFGSEQGATREIKGSVSIQRSDGRSAKEAFRLVKVREVDEFERMGSGGRDELKRARIYKGEGGAKRFVPGNEEIESGVERGEVKRARDAESGRDDVSRAVGFELIQEPKPLLRV